MIRSLLSHFSSLVMALLFAIVVWAVATGEENPSSENFYPYLLPIEIVNRPDGTVVYSKTAETVRVKLRAPQASWDQIQSASFRVQADLQGLTPGMQQVLIKVQVTDPRVTVLTIEPAAVGIRLEQLKSRDFDIHSEVLDAAPLGYEYKPPVLTPAQVTVSGPAILTEQVVEVAADIYLRGAKTPIEREISLQPRDLQGNVVQGVTLTPAVSTAKVPVEQRVGYKDVSIKAMLKGTVAPGYWISNIVVSPASVTVAGSPEVMAKLPGFIETVAVEMNQATAEVTKRVAISLPEGVSVVNNEGVTVQVSVTPILGGQTIRRKVVLQGLRRGLVGTLSPDSVDVILSGPLPSLQILAADDVQIVIDASTLITGSFQLKPRVPIVPDALKVQNIVPDTIQVVITEVVPTTTPLATPIVTPLATPIATSTPTTK